MKKQSTKETIKKTVKEVEENSTKKVDKKNKLPKALTKTGSTLWNLTIGGGFPAGFANIVGDSGSGKSFLAGEIIAWAYHNIKGDFDWFYDNAEKGYRFDSKKLYKFDILKDGFFPENKRSKLIEDFEKNIFEILKKKDPKTPFIYVIDSWDGISSRPEKAFYEKKMKSKMSDDDEEESDDKKKKKEKGTYGLTKQKDTHQFMRINMSELEENNILLIFISQVREKIDSLSFVKQQYRTGGRALDFWPHIVFWLAERHRHIKKGIQTGVCVRLMATKTRNDKPFRTCLIDLVFDYGIDNVLSNINYLYDLKTELDKDKKRLECEWDGQFFQRDDLITFIEDNNLEDELEKRVIEKWEALEEEVSSKDRKKRF